MALLSEQAQCCAMRAIPSRRTRTMPSTPQMVSSRKRTRRLVFSLSSSGRLLSFMGTSKALQALEGAGFGGFAHNSWQNRLWTCLQE